MCCLHPEPCQCAPSPAYPLPPPTHTTTAPFPAVPAFPFHLPHTPYPHPTRGDDEIFLLLLLLLTLLGCGQPAPGQRTNLIPGLRLIKPGEIRRIPAFLPAHPSGTLQANLIFIVRFAGSSCIWGARTSLPHPLPAHFSHYQPHPLRPGTQTAQAAVPDIGMP